LLVFAVAKEMFGSVAAFIALTLLVFEPNILAHGALVTIDVGFSGFLLTTSMLSIAI
jgi:4-amino-4-deoxy-L-arabinose transferase-like glycosyltransferase